MQQRPVLQRLKDRKLVQWAVAYLAGAWLVMQVVDVLADRWPVPLGLQRGIDLVLALGLAAVLILAWYHGERGRQRATGPELLMLGALFLIGGGVLPLVRSPERTPETAPAGPPATAPDERRGIAVLPFANLSEDRAEAYLVDGMHEALITDLSKIRSLRVISRTSVMQYRGGTTPVPEIAEALGVAAIVESSLFRYGDSVRVTARLIDARGDRNLWTATFEGRVSGLIGMTRDVARSLADEFAVLLTPRESELLATPTPVDPEAYEAYLRGRFAFNARAFDDAIGHYETALRVEPEFALAQAGLASTYYMRGFFGGAPYEDAVRSARSAVSRAFELDTELSEAHATSGFIRLYWDWDWAGAELAFLRALELNPNDGLARHGYADLLTVAARPDEAVAQVQLALQADPLSPLANLGLIGHLFFAARYEDVLVEQTRLEALLDAPGVGRSFVGLALWQLGRYDEAIRRLEVSWPDDARFRSQVWSSLEASGPEAAMAVVAARFEADRSRGPGTIAMYHALAGDPERAIEWLGSERETRGPGILHSLANPALAQLAGKPSFEELRASMGLPAVLTGSRGPGGGM